LLADFEGLTLQGSAEGLSIDGTFGTDVLVATVTYNGVPGQVFGLVGADTFIGAFHGSDDDSAFAGGFVAED
jgi:hypothetical protein